VRRSNRGAQIRGELLALRNSDGKLMPKVAIDWAEEHPDSALYSSLEWDNEVAGQHHREWQMRQLINLHLSPAAGSEGPRFVSLSIDRVTGGGYRDISDVMADADLREIAISDALAELERTQRKYTHLQELEQVWAAREQVQTEVRVRAAAKSAARRPRGPE
jgi:hypothetical protein